MDDPRFSHVATDPRFKAAPRKRHKVTVDSRFKSMFTDKKFKVNYHVDKRGRKVSESSKENLKRYYNLDDEDNAEDRADRSYSDQSSVEDDEEMSETNGNTTAEEGTDDEEESDGSSTDLDCDAFTQDNEVTYEWGEFASDVTRSHDVSYRLAVCNMDWDRITAEDLFVLFNSFKPRNGSIISVKIYLSDFGKERLEKEDIEGPAELVGKDSTARITETAEEGEDPDKIEGRNFAREKLRQYQLNRLKYYYAIVECDSVATAEHIYNECDEMEYENSASTIDLRFVPVAMEFTDVPNAVAMENSITPDFVPSTFFTSALQQTNVSLTWDETDHSRLKKTMKSFSKDELENIDYGAYLGSSSEEEVNGDSLLPPKKDSNAYRALLGFAEKKEVDENKDGDDKEEMQITWNIGLKEKKKKKSKSKQRNNDELKEEELDGSDVNAGFNDPFFTSSNTAAYVKKNKKKKGKLSASEKEEQDKKMDELELLMMSDEEDVNGSKNRQHFSLKDLTAAEKKESAKKKRRKRKFEDKNENDADAAATDDFKVDTDDPRFNALYDSPLFAVDRSNPQYKKTRGMEEILSEKQKRSEAKRSKAGKEISASDSTDQSIGALMKSVKAKAVKYMEMKKRKQKRLISH